VTPTGRTAVFGLIGQPIAHSLSPSIWNHLFAEHQMDAVYVALPAPPDAGGAALATSIRTLGLAAVNLTIPHKTAILPYLDELSDAARRAGAVNFVRCVDGRLLGDNTDGGGFMLSLSLEHGLIVKDRRTVILGAGGAARAVAAELAYSGAAEVVLLNRTAERAHQAVVDLRAALGSAGRALAHGSLTADSYARRAAKADLVVNCTGGGARGLINGFDPTILSSDAVWSDLNYWDDRPPLLQLHRDRQLKTQDGLMMLVCQAVLAFQAVSDARPDPRQVFDALNKGWLR